MGGGRCGGRLETRLGGRMLGVLDSEVNGFIVEGVSLSGDASPRRELMLGSSSPVRLDVARDNDLEPACIAADRTS